MCNLGKFIDAEFVLVSVWILHCACDEGMMRTWQAEWAWYWDAILAYGTSAGKLVVSVWHMYELEKAKLLIS